MRREVRYVSHVGMEAPLGNGNKTAGIDYCVDGNWGGGFKNVG
jgi:hypothetical protein